MSAIKVDGVRAYAKVRAGEAGRARGPTGDRVARFDVLAGAAPTSTSPSTCSSGTYVRALARDLGAALGVGGHLTALRRTRVGPFDLAQARTARGAGGASSTCLPLDAAVGASFPRRDLDAEEAVSLSYGKKLAAPADRGWSGRSTRTAAASRSSRTASTGLPGGLRAA